MGFANTARFCTSGFGSVRTRSVIRVVALPSNSFCSRAEKGTSELMTVPIAVLALNGFGAEAAQAKIAVVSNSKATAKRAKFLAKCVNKKGMERAEPEYRD